MRALLVSTYDLGRQPFGLASPAAWLRGAGADVTCVDASRDPLQDDQIAAATFVAFYLPMHTATRLAAPLIARARALNPTARLCAYGLYAPLNERWLREQGVHDVLGPECEEQLVGLVNGERPQPGARSLARLQFIQPDRAGLPPLHRYAALQMPDGTRRVVGSTPGQSTAVTVTCGEACARAIPHTPDPAAMSSTLTGAVAADSFRSSASARAAG